MKILGTGLSGLVGSRVVELLSTDFSFENLSLETGVDITQKDIVTSRIAASSASWVFHFAASTEVDETEKERSLGKDGKAWKVNVGATQYIVDACRNSGKRLLYLSTDFVFDGMKDIYTEEDIPNPAGWYAVTKYEAEKRVATLAQNSLIVRIAFPYKAKNDNKKDFLHRMLDVLRSGKHVVAPSDQIFAPTFIDDIATALRFLVDKNVSGIYHAVGSQYLSPFEAAQKVALSFGLPLELVKQTTFIEYYKDRAPRPFHAHLSNVKIKTLGLKMSTFDDGLKKIKSQLE